MAIAKLFALHANAIRIELVKGGKLYKENVFSKGAKGQEAFPAYK